MAGNFFDQFDTQQGDPVIARDPYKVNAEGRAQQDQAFQAQTNAREEAKFRAQYNPDGTPKQEWQALSDSEARAANLPVTPGTVWQRSRTGEVKQVGQAKSTGDAITNTRNLLQSAGVDLARGIDPVADLIKKSTSGRGEHWAAGLYGAVTGDATDGMEAIGALQTIASDMTLQMTGGSLGNQISNADREFISQRIGDIGNPDVPASQRLAAWNAAKARFQRILGGGAQQSRPPRRGESGWWGSGHPSDIQDIMRKYGGR